MKSWIRNVNLNRSNETIEISDSFSLNNPVSLKQVFMTVCDVDLSGVGTIKLKTPANKTVYLDYDATKWTVSLDKPSTDGAEYSSFKTKWDTREVKRIILVAKSLKAIDSANYSIRTEK